jgi:hypothetical protein
LLVVVEQVHGVQQADEAALSALQLRPQEITHPERYQVDVLHSFGCLYILPCLQEVVDERVGVGKHE